MVLLGRGEAFSQRNSVVADTAAARPGIRPQPDGMKIVQKNGHGKREPIQT